MRNWIIKIVEQALQEEIKELRQCMYEIHTCVFEIKDYVEAIDVINKDNENFKVNSKKLNEMILELKGAVAMARSCVPKEETSRSKSKKGTKK